MSTTVTKRRHAQALSDAEALKALFPTHTYTSWTFAGSLRRNRPEVGDVEHVIIPAYADGVTNSLFGQAPKINLFLSHLDSLLSTDHLCKHIYGETGFRWGEKYRGVDFRGFNHEFFIADESNYGPTLAIRTGPADFSRRLVTGLLRNGRRNDKGKVWKCVPCSATPPGGVRCAPLCPLCRGTGLEPVAEIPAKTEQEYFDLCGVEWIEPDRRT